MRGRHRCALAAASLLLVLAWHQSADAQERAPLPRVTLQDEGRGAVWQTVAEAGAQPVAVAVRVLLTDSGAGADAFAALDRILARAASPRAALWLAVAPPSTRDTLEPWRTALRRLIDRAGASLIVLELSVDTQPPDVVRFATQVAATELGARRGGIRVALGGPAMEDERRRAAIYQQDLAPSVDLLVISESNRRRAATWLDGVDRDARLAVTGRSIADGGLKASVDRSEEAVRAIIQAVVDDVGTTVATAVWPGSEVTASALAGLSSLERLVGREVSSIDPQSVGLTVKVGSDPSPSSLHVRLLFDTTTFSTLLVYWGVTSPQPLSVSLRVSAPGAPVVVDLLSRASSPALSYTRDDASAITTTTLPLTGNPTLVDFNDGTALAGEGTSVNAARLLSVDEIIARHRRQQLVQDRLVRNYIAHAQTRQFFRPTITDPGYDVVTENRYFVAGDGIEWEQLSFSVNNRRFENEPPFPLLQPEKAFALPLQLRFDEGYRYRLAGTARVGEVDCYEVQFEPERDDPALYRGTVWIDRQSFARIRLQAVQGGLPGMVISNDETQRYAAVTTLDDQPIFLLSSATSRQIVLFAGRNISFEKTMTFSGFRVNDRAFDDERAAARRSDRVMYRETPNGLRPFVKQDTTRVVVNEPTPGVKAVALGVIVDPSYQFPLPIFGINFVDFAFRNPNTQLAMLFAGVLAAGNIQRPQLFGSRHLTGSLDFFAIAAPSSDRVYEESGEIESARLLTWPLTTGLNVGWQATPFQKLSLQYQFRFDAYVRDTTTAESFTPPASTVTNGVGGAWEYSRGGYTAVVNGAWFARAGWEPWGDEAGELLVTPRSYTKYSASISRDFLLSLFQKFNVNAAWFGGRQLDRFVKYQFGIFDTTRIHGVPSAVRFGELAMARGSYSINVFNQYRLDLFLDHAWGRDDSGDEWHRLPGVGGAFNLPGPWNTIVRADVGKSWLPDRYGSLGSVGLQVMLLKPLR